MTAPTLVIIDVQQRLVPAMAAFGPVWRNLTRLIDGWTALGLPVLLTEQYPAGLGPTIRSLAARLPGTALPKVAFSCFGCESFGAALPPHGALVLAGLEAHVCVTQTALEGLAAGHPVTVVADAVTSRQTAQRDLALARLRHAGASVAATEAVLFEQLQVAGSPAFRQISRLVR
ncbi:MAG: isochorismatase family protein [Fimbriimonadaceae bacterium]|nr:isochorismatase family protein [Fimbriimonadaceae bacterium]